MTHKLDHSDTSSEPMHSSAVDLDFDSSLTTRKLAADCIVTCSVR